MYRAQMAFGRLMALFALLVMIQIGIAHQARTAEPPFIFSAISAPENPTDWAAVLGGIGGIKKPEKAAAIAALTAAERNPSLATAVGLLAHFETFAKNPEFRSAALEANIDVFRMADLAKYELVTQTSARIHKNEEGGIAAVVRVGSSGARYQAWLDWSKNDPRGPMPVDLEYELSKLFKSDDDVTHWASDLARLASSVANELINGEAAARVFAEITGEHLAEYPDELRSIKLELDGEEVDVKPLAGVTEIHPSKMMVEFLSPTRAREIMADDAERKRRGWPLLIDLTEKNFLPAWILAEPEKYNGLFASEQLHKWGVDAGFVTEDPDNPTGSTIRYADSATKGVLKSITGDDEFPDGIRDPFGWMANNYRQIFQTHRDEIEKGEFDALAKYTIRMEDWWKNVGLKHDESLALTQDVVVPDFDVKAELKPLQDAMNEIRKPTSEEARNAAVKRAAATESALFGKLVKYNEQMLIAGHRKHFNVLAETLTKAIAANHKENPPRPGEEQKTLTLDDIWKLTAGARGSVDDPAAKDHNIFHFRQSLQAMANGYANLPEETVQMLATDLAGFIDRDAKQEDGNVVRAQIRAAIIPTLREAVEQARQVGAELKGQSQAFTDLKDLRDSPVGAAINRELETLKQPDLDNYLLKIVRGDLTIRRVIFDPGTDGGWPAIRVVDAQWSPNAVASDVDRIAKLAKQFGWSNAGYAQRLANYFGGPLDASGNPDPAFPDRAINLFLEIGRLFEPGSSISRKVNYLTIDGEQRTVTIETTKFWDSSLNIGHMLFTETVKGGEIGIKMWGIKGDIESARGLYDAMAKIISPDRNATPESRAVALAAAASNALSLTGYVEMGLAKAGYKDAAGALGETSIIGRFGNTFGAAAQFSNDPLSREAPAAFAQAVMQDLLIWAQPQVATALVLHAIYKDAGKRYTEAYSKSALIDLFLNNGRWSFPADGRKPVLDAVYAHGRWIADDQKARSKQCRQRLISQGTIGSTPTFSPIGAENLFRLPKDAEKEGIALCSSPLGVDCPKTDGSRVKPREELLALYATAGYHQSDPLQKITQDAASDMLSWGAGWDVLRDIAGATDISQIGKRDLEGHGILVPTPEDATHFVREKIRIKDEPLGVFVEPDAFGTRVEIGPTWIQDQLNVGARKVYGYLVSQSWVRRQHILDCTMLNPIIAEAGKKAQEERIKALEPTDFLSQLEVFDARIKAIDNAIWPRIALSADAYPADFPDDGDKVAILRDFRKLTNDQRAALKAIDDWSKNPTQNDVPWFARPFDPNFTPDPGPFDSPVDFPSDRPVEEQMLNAGRDHLRSVLNAVSAFEEAFDASRRTMDGVVALAKSADKLDINPLHLHILPPDSDTGNPDIPPVTVPEKTPTPEIFDGKVKSHKTLVDLKKTTADWDKVYTDARHRAFGDMESRMAAFQTRLQPALLDLLGTSSLIDNPLSAIAREKPGDLALNHPLWPRILRLSLQSVRLDHAKKDAERMDEAEFTALIQSITLYPVDGETPDQEAGKGDYATRIDALKSSVDSRYVEMLKLVEQMFEMSFKTDGAKWVVLGQPEVQLMSRPLPDSGIKQETVEEWSATTVWELVPASDDMLKDVEALVSMSGDDQDNSIPSLSAITEETERTDRAVADALGICGRSNRSDYFQRTFRSIAKKKQPTITYPLTKAGRYLMRITVLTDKGVPLAQRQAFVIVRAGTLKGSVILEGGLQQNRSVRLAFGRSRTPDLYQVIDVQGAGQFEAAICEFTADEVIREEGGEPRIISDSDLDRRFQARSVAIAGVTQPLTGKPATAIYKLNNDYLVEKRHFELENDLVLSDSGLVSVNVEVNDWSEAALPGAETTITAGDVTDVSKTEGEYELSVGDLVKAVSKMQVDGETATGRSPSVFFNTANHSGGITLVVDVPVFDIGNLTVTGTFKPDKEAQALGGIARGVAYSNIARGQPIGISGPDFVFFNTVPIAASNGFKLSALLVAPDEKASFLAPKCPENGSDICTIDEELKKGSQLPLKPVPVGPFSTKAQNLTVFVTDWTGAPIATDLVNVTIGGKQAGRDFSKFFGKLAFSGEREAVQVKATYKTGDGREISAETELEVDAIGDPLSPRQPDAVTLKLPVYPLGRMRIAGNLKLETSDGSPEGTPATLIVQAAHNGDGDPYNSLVGERLLLEISSDVEPGETITVSGDARFGSRDYKGERLGVAPLNGPANQPAVLDIGDFVLRAGDASKEDTDEEEPAPPPVVEVPSVVNEPLEVAEGLLDGAKLVMWARPLDGDPGANLPRHVVRQAPNPGATLAEKGTVTVFYYPEPPAEIDSALVEPEPEPVPEPEPQPEPEPDQSEAEAEPDAEGEGDGPVPDAEPEAPVAVEPAAERYDYAGSWLGTLRVTSLDGQFQGLKIKCASFNQCADIWTGFAYRMLDAELEQQEEREELNDDMSAGELLAESITGFGEGMLDGIGTGILLAGTVGAMIGFDFAFDGGPAGFVLTRTESGYDFGPPDLGQPDVEEAPETLAAIVEPDGSLLIDYSQSKEGATATVVARFQPRAEGGETILLDLALSLAHPAFGDLKIEFAGAFDPGVATEENTIEVIASDFQQRCKNPQGDLKVRLDEMRRRLKPIVGDTSLCGD